MMPLLLFRDPEFSLGLLMGWISFLILGGMFILPIYLQAAEGYSPQQAGFLMLVLPVSMGIVSPLAGWCADRFGPRVVSLLGLMILVGGCLTLSGITLHVSVLEYVLRVLPLGVGLGLFQAPQQQLHHGPGSPQPPGPVLGPGIALAYSGQHLGGAPSWARCSACIFCPWLRGRTRPTSWVLRLKPWWPE